MQITRGHAAIACMAVGIVAAVAAALLALGLAAALGVAGVALVGLSLLLGWDR